MQRAVLAEKGIRSALNSADKNLIALGQTKGVGNQVALLVRPQEAVAAVQALAQAYIDYYGAVADSNRAQFRLYRALGQPAQCVMHARQPTPPYESPTVSLLNEIKIERPASDIVPVNADDQAPQWKASPTHKVKKSASN